MVKLGLLLCVMTTPLTVLGVSTQMGRLFLFIPIKMHDEGQHLAIFFFTMAHNKVSVKVTFPWYKGEEEHISKQPDHQTVDVDRMGTSSLMLHQDYYIRENCGPSFTYKFEATDDFGINVLLEQNQYSVDTFTAVPITGWGKTYYTMQLDEQQAFTVANGETENKVSVTFKSLNKDHKVDYKGKQYKDGETLEVDLKKFEGFSIQLCWDNREQWSGTKIQGKENIGVVIGNCVAKSQNSIPKCENMGKDTWDKKASMDVLVEMLLPSETFGREFIAIQNAYRRLPLTVMILARELNTVVTFYIDDQGNTETFRIQKERDWIFFDDVKMYGKVMKFETDKPVQVMFLERSSCSEDGGDNPGEPGDPAMCLAIPTALFYDMYIFSTPNTKQVIPENYLTLVIEEPNKEILQFDDQKFPHDESVVWKPVLGMEEWVVGSIKTKPGTHALQGTRMFYFGCYLYGYHMHYGYMQPAGFMSSPIDDVENCENTQKSSSRGDLIDNDCDGRVDEELYDGWDNDHDGAADEDLAKPDRVNGGWAEWRAWGCTQNCSVTDEERFRRCTNPQPVNFGANCPGFNRQPRKGKCWIKTRCPTTCPKLRFGFECAKSCANCFTDCNKFNGTCNGTCVIGYQDLEEMCLIPCNSGWYGENCEESCEEKCGGDCAETVEGTCPPRYWLVALGVLTIFAIVGGSIYWWQQREPSQKVVYGEDNRSYVAHSGSSAFTFA